MPLCNLRHSIVIVLMVALSLNPFQTQDTSKDTNVAPCPAQLEKHDKIVEAFLTKTNWETERQETGTTHLTVSQITPLKSQSFSGECQQINTIFQEAINTAWSDGTPKYNLTYYKVGNFYFIASTLRQKEDSNSFIVGYSSLFIYDQNYQKVAGWGF